jgi:hypothetical protein
MDKKDTRLWWIISLIALPLLVVQAVLTTVLLIIMLNGYPFLPDAMPVIYAVCTSSLLLALSLACGLAPKKLAQSTSMPMWASGMLMMLAGLMMLPIALCLLTFALLGAFGML